MEPFKTVPPSQYKRENFFPCITQEYRRCVREDFWIMPQEEIDQFVDDGPEFLDDERDPFDYEKPYYDPDVYDEEPIEKGDHLDVISLLSGGCQDGRLIRCGKDNPDKFDRVGLKDSLENKKYVLLVSVFAPAKWCQNKAERLCQLSVLSLELLSSQPNDFEMVIVAKMRQDTSTGCEYDVDAFNQFFSAFPGRLAVPYSEAKICDSVCTALGFDGRLKVILVGPDSTVLQDDVSFLIDYGSVGFPFTDDRLKTLAEEREKLSLSGLLGHDPSFRLHKLNPHEDTESQSIEQLNKKLVGLYLFQRGDKLPRIHEVYNQCRDRDRAKGLESQFEIVIVCMPFFVSTHPRVFQEEVFSLLNRLKLEFDLSSWWVFDYDNSVCLRLWEMSRKHAFAEDGMIIVGPHDSFFDPCGAHVISKFGFTAYPFTREAVVDRFVKSAKEVTLESLLLPDQPLALNRKKIYASVTCVERGGERVALTELKGKNVLFYLYNPTLFGTMVDWYPKIKQVDPNFELVLVASKDSDVDSANIPELWLVCRCEPEHLTYLMYNHDAFYGGFAIVDFRKGLHLHPVLAFGKDGYIHSLDPLHIYNINGHSSAFPFHPVYNDLRSDIIRKITNCFEFMCGYEDEHVSPSSLQALRACLKVVGK